MILTTKQDRAVGHMHSSPLSQFVRRDKLRNIGWVWSEPILLLGMYNYGYTTRRERKTAADAIFFFADRRECCQNSALASAVRIWLGSFSEPALHAYYVW